MNAGLKVRTIVAQVEGTPLPPEPSPDQDANGRGAGQRNIPRGHEFDARSLKPLSRALFSASVALGHSVTAYKEFARVKSSSVSPDGMLGGRGYVMNVKDVRSHLQEACELLSTITDTLYDEINGPHWKPKMAELPDNEAEDISELVDEAGQVINDPEAFGEKEIEEVEARNDGGGDKEKASEVPETGGPETTPAAPFGAGGANVKQASEDLFWKAPSALKAANSSLPVNTLPGPRVDHLDRADQQTGPGGSYNKDEDPVDGWDEGPREGDYTSLFAQELPVEARSSVPDNTTDPTETSANDFGVGFGAKGEGSEGYGTKAPDGRGVAGPSSELPNDPGAKTRDDEDGANQYLNSIERNLWATAEVPTSGPPARSDYYQGDKGNQFNVSVRGEAELPGESSTYNYDRDLPNLGDEFEHQDVPYIKYDHTVHDYRHEPQDLYQYDKLEKTNG